MKTIYYSAAWADSGFFVDCSHAHESIGEADSCIPCAGGYIVAVQNGVTRALTAEEEAEFQLAHYPLHCAAQGVPEETVADDPRYAVMIRIRARDRWTWTTWMIFATYGEAAAHARRSNKVVRFRSAEYAALRKQTESASPLVIKATRERIRPQGEAETFVEFVNRFLGAYGFAQPAEPHSHEKHGSVDPAGLIPIGGQEDGSLTSEFDEHTAIIETPTYFARLIFGRLGESEIGNIARMSDEDIVALLNVLAIRFLTLRPKGRCH